ncbi:hypothetical protein F3Y22_tig00111088pilonHSYRG00075 [Hibiscus syriacus]|uniref:Uncharacterized protein n=1 Tax=Hibiscus syriacus TaxID=106335 RepID=A0A6A2Z3A9_HIBSY|nr:hypothetical protein F3Y22_tig00111088pilonHSYRG00075 [Hibiscus syriacus]
MTHNDPPLIIPTDPEWSSGADAIRTWWLNQQLQTKEESKLPLQVTVIDDREKYSFQPGQLKLEIAAMYFTGKVEVWFDRYIMKKNQVTCTHSFVTNMWGKEGLELEETNPLVITVVNDDKLYSTSKSKQLSWEMKDFTFVHDFRVLPLGGSDMVIGVDWMKKCIPVLMDFNRITVSFKMGDQEIVLKGGLNNVAMKIISGNKMQKLITRNLDLLGEMYMLNAEVGDNVIPHTIQAVIADCKDVFEEPTGMPPIRKHDHSITLKSGTETVNVRPYKMPYHQKQRLRNKWLRCQLPQLFKLAKAPFASPCLLVKKKDGSWRT